MNLTYRPAIWRSSSPKSSWKRRSCSCQLVLPGNARRLGTSVFAYLCAFWNENVSLQWFHADHAERTEAGRGERRAHARRSEDAVHARRVSGVGRIGRRRSCVGFIDLRSAKGLPRFEHAKQRFRRSGRASRTIRSPASAFFVEWTSTGRTRRSFMTRSTVPLRTVLPRRGCTHGLTLPLPTIVSLRAVLVAGACTVANHDLYDLALTGDTLSPGDIVVFGDVPYLRMSAFEERAHATSDASVTTSSFGDVLVLCLTGTTSPGQVRARRAGLPDVVLDNVQLLVDAPSGVDVLADRCSRMRVELRRFLGKIASARAYPTDVPRDVVRWQLSLLAAIERLGADELIDRYFEGAPHRGKRTRSIFRSRIAPGRRIGCCLRASASSGRGRDLRGADGAAARGVPRSGTSRLRGGRSAHWIGRVASSGHGSAWRPGGVARVCPPLGRRLRGACGSIRTRGGTLLRAR